MRSARLSLAARSGAAGLGGKQAVARDEGGSLPGGFSRPLIPVDVVWSGRRGPAAGSGHLPREGGSGASRKRLELGRGSEARVVPHARRAVWLGAGPGAGPACLRGAPEGVGGRPTERGFCEETWGRFDSEKRKSLVERERGRRGGGGCQDGVGLLGAVGRRLFVGGFRGACLPLALR